MVDIEIGGGNGFYTITGTSDAGREWLNENVQTESWQWLGNSICCDDTNMAMSIAKGAQADGLEVR